MTTIERLRREKGMSQETSALIAGVSTVSWIRAENGKNTTLFTLRKMAKTLGVKTREIIED